jgi:hypothetical protein
VKVITVPGSDFYVPFLQVTGGRDDDGHAEEVTMSLVRDPCAVRIAFAAVTQDQIREGALKMTQVLKRFLGAEHFSTTA